MQIHTPRVSRVVKVRGGGRGWNPSREFLICCSILILKWKAFDLPIKQDEVHFKGSGAAGGL